MTLPAAPARQALEQPNTWKSLAAHKPEIANTHLLSLFAEDPERAETFQVVANQGRALHGARQFGYPVDSSLQDHEEQRT